MYTRRVSIFLVTVVLIAGMVGCDGGAGIFADPNLEAVIRETIDKPTGLIYSSDLEGLPSLYAAVRDISNLTGLGYATCLTALDLRRNQISDISPLVENQGLGTRDSVYLWDNPLSSDSINIYRPQLEARGVAVH